MNKSSGRIGLELRTMERVEFRQFAVKHATSPEIGRIATYLDDENKVGSAGTEVWLSGLFGCNKVCAAICCLLTPSADGTSRAVKLDSIIVDNDLRRNGLGVGLVAHSFLSLVENSMPKINNIYAHSVHPATVRLLHSLAFHDPLVTGAPISSIDLVEDSAAFNRCCSERLATVTSKLKLNCSYCRSDHRKTVRWCGIK